jgi:hypothetical protein
MGIFGRIFHLGSGKSSPDHEGHWPLDDEAMLTHIARHDEDPDVRRSARALLEETFGVVLEPSPTSERFPFMNGRALR